jgi:hypothetical protein
MTQNARHTVLTEGERVHGSRHVATEPLGAVGTTGV